MGAGGVTIALRGSKGIKMTLYGAQSATRWEGCHNSTAPCHCSGGF